MPPGDFLTDPCPQRTACAQHPAPRLTENGRPETAVDRKDEGRRGGSKLHPHPLPTPPPLRQGRGISDSKTAYRDARCRDVETGEAF